MRQYLLPLVFLGLLQEASAQWAIRATALHWERFSPRGQLNILVAGEHDLNTRLSISLEYNRSINLFSLQENPYYYGSGYGDDELQRKANGLTYRAAYFFSDNDERSALYLGPYFGFRSIKYIFTKSEPSPDYNYSYTYVTTTTSGTGLLFPLGLRFGWRTPLDGYSGDMYVSVGTLLGEKNIIRAGLLEKRDIIGGPFIQLGYSLGVGW